MREGFDKEIDSLLRRRARAATVARPRGNGADAPPSDAHLDADELSAFAEGLMPAPARALSLVAAVTFVALRSRRGEVRLAQQSANAAAPRADITSTQKEVETN